MPDNGTINDNAPRAATSRGLSLRWVILLGLAMAFAFQGSRGLWSPDEGRYVGSALQMIDSGNFLAPAYSPDAFNFSKPPLTYWIIAASIELFGHNTWAARAPYAMAFAATLWVLYTLGTRLLPAKPWLPPLAYACAVFPYLTSNVVSTDVFLTLFEGIAVVGFVQVLHPLPGDKRARNLALMWSGFGLAFLTKGPPGLLPLLAIFIYVGIFQGWRHCLRLFSLAGAALFVVIGLTWYLVAVLRYPGLLHYFLHQEVYDRIFTAIHRRHPGWFGWAFVYLPVLVVGTLPWWASLLRAARPSFSPAQWKAWRRTPAIEPFLAIWFAVPFLVFCLAQSRLPLYVLPLFLPLMLLVARQVAHNIDLDVTRHRLMVGGWIVLLVAVKAGAAYLAHPDTDNRRAAAELAASIPASSFDTVVFVEDTDEMYAIQERTPWGVRLYLGKPVYGVAWQTPLAARALCAAAQSSHSALVVVDASLTPMPVTMTLTHCGVRSITLVGTWRGRSLLRVLV